MDRVPEPELMDEPKSAAAYAAADFSEPNERLCGLLLTDGVVQKNARILDLGCGPADIPIRLGLARPDLHVDAVDGSAAMLAHARAAVKKAGLGERVRLHHARIPGLPLPPGAYDAIISNSLLHHLPDPSVLWREVARMGRSGALVLVMDLRRPDSRAQVTALVQQHAAGEPEILRRDFEASLHAAFRTDEVHRQLLAAGLGELTVEAPSDRHLLVRGRLP